MAQVVLSLGANIGDKENNINRALLLIKERIGEVTLQSSLYSSQPQGFDSVNNFVNIALLVESSLSAMEVLEQIWKIEESFDRIKEHLVDRSKAREYKDRTMDIDIVFYDERVINTPYLTLPHPLMHTRDFVVVPLAEIIPFFVHPTLKLNIKQLRDNLWKSL